MAISLPSTTACEVWRAVLDGYPGNPPAPVLDPTESTVYLVSSKGTVYVLDAATGVVRWSAPGNLTDVTTKPALANGRL